MRSTNVKTHIILLAGFALLPVSIAAGQTTKKEVPMTIRSLPAAARATAKEQSKGATILEITKELDEGKMVYELAMKLNGRTKDIIIAADGTLLTIEAGVLLTELPPAVRATFEKSAGKGKLSKIETVTTRGTLAYYEALVRTGKKISEIKVGLDGKLIPASAK